jgi:hypothetical protein
MSYPARHRYRDRHKARKSVVPVILAIGILLASGIVGTAYLIKSPTPSKVLFGIGPEADSARQTPLAAQSPIKMLSSWYNGPNDLSWMSGWQHDTIPSAYAAGYALHLIVWTGDPEKTMSTTHGDACGRSYPLSPDFLDDMTRLATIFAGPKGGPPLYVTMFTEFQTYPCVDNSYSPDQPTTNYYLALKDQYRAAYAIFHRLAPNAEVSLGWGGWQASYDDPATGGGRAMFGEFADILRMSDFESFQAMDSRSNTAAISAMVSILGAYGPVMLAHYKPDDGSQSVFDADLRTVLSPPFLRGLVAHGLFAISLMDKTNVSADPAIFQFVKASVTTYARGWSPTF